MKHLVASLTQLAQRRFAFHTLTLAVIALLLVGLLSSPAAFAQCTLGSPDTWTHGSSGNWNTAANWSGGVPNNSGTNVCITDGLSAVALDINASIASLQLAGGNVLNLNANTQLSVFGGQILNAGLININGGGNSNTYLYLPNGSTTTLSGGGTLSINTTTTGGGGNALLYLQNGTTLINADNTIQGEGYIYNNGTTITNQSGGTINANSSGSPLVNYLVLEYGQVNNAGLLEATNSGDLVLYSTTVNNAGGTVTANGANAVVDLQASTVQGGTIHTLNGGTVQTSTGYAATLDGSTGAGAITINGTYLTPGNASTYLHGSITGGTLQVNGGSNTNSYLYVPSSVTLTGTTVNLQTGTSGGGGDAYLYLQNGTTLDIANSTVQGEGVIYNNGTTINNHANGVINASQIGSSPLYYLQLEYGTVNNLGLMEATNGGQLAFYSTTINNQGGNITNNTSGGTAGVYLYSTTVVGGNLNNNTTGFLGTASGYSATLDGSTAQGAITINGTYTSQYNSNTYLYGSFVNNGTLLANGGGNTNTYLYVPANVSLTGGGAVTLSTTTAGGGGNAYLYLYNGSTLDNVNNTIQGTGFIYNNGTTLNNHAAGIINATPLATTPQQLLELEYGTVNNGGLIEASNGGALYLYSTTVNNAGGNITNNSTGTGSGIYFLASTIQGGNLNNTSGSFFGTPTGYNAYLDGNSGPGPITINGVYTTQQNSNTYLYGSIINKGTLLVLGGGNTNSYNYISTDSSLTGGGTLTLNTTTTGGGGNAWLYLYNGATLDNVNNTIQGEGFIYNNGTVLNNHAAGIINATLIGSSPSPFLEIEYGTVNNTGLIEASNGGALYLTSTTVNNAGGNITNNSTGSGSGVYLTSGTHIVGGNLNNNTSAFFGTPSGNTAYLDGSTGAGAVTMTGTYTVDYNAANYWYGSINNQGNVLLNGGNNTNSYIYVNLPVSLSGNGTLTLSTDTTNGGGDAWLYLYNGATLTNVDNTIQGEGVIYNNGTTFINGAAGTLWANSTGSPLTTSILLQYGTVTNNGTFQVSAGNLLWLNQSALTNYSANTLTGGAYNIYGANANPGTLQIDSLGNTGGEIINNAATIYLNGPNSNFVDQAGLNALSNFSNNTATGSFTITNGRNFTSPSSVNFANAGAVIIGGGSTFTTGGGRNYTQSSGSTQLNGSLVAGGNQANFNGGVLFGNGGTVTGNVTMAATIAPAATVNGSGVPLSAGQLNIVGNYNQTSAGIFDLGIGGLMAGSQFGFLGITGNALIDGTLNVNLLNGFFPSVGDTFTFLTTGGTVIGTFSSANGLNIGNGEILNVIYGSNYIQLSTAYTSTTDLWLGGTGVWSNGSQWSIGVPQPSFDTIIYSGGNDHVTLDVASSTVSSLTVGGANNGFTSVLIDKGTTPQTLTVTNGLTVGQQGDLYFNGAGSLLTAATISNSGYISLGQGATLNLTGQPNGVTTVASGAGWYIGGNFSVGGVANTGFANLSNNAGSVVFADGASQVISPFLINTGAIDVASGSALTTLSGVDNSGAFTAGYAYAGNNSAIIINGTLTNNAGGFVDIEGGSTLTVNGNLINNASGPQGVYTSYNGTGGNQIQVTGTLTNNGMFGLESLGDKATVGGAVSNTSGALFALTGGSSATFNSTLNNSGTMDLENASSLTVHGAATNSGTLATSEFGGTGGNTMTFTALLTNSGSGQININGPGDTLKASAGIANNGTITVKNGSTVDPPTLNNIGIVNIDATSTFVVGTGSASGPGYVQLANGTLGEMISNSNFGQVFVNGSASLDGTLDILLQNGFNPSVGATYDIILFSPGGLSGVFASIQNQVFNGGTEIWQINYDNVNGLVSLTAASNNQTTPEPGTLLLLGSGLLGVACTARRRWRK